MQTSIWIFLAGLLGFLTFQVVRGTRAGKQERRRLQALFSRITGCSCPLCGTTYGTAVEKHIQISFTDENQLPANLAGMERLNTWRIACPHCRGFTLLAENEDIFELLKMFPMAAEKSLNPAYLALVILLSVAVLGASIYSIVRFFMR
jgi:hypothetical protein